MISNKTTTLKDLKAAEQALEKLEERNSGDTSGNPEKNHTRLNEARRKVRQLTENLKSQSKLPYSENELLWQKLDQEFPKARSKEIVNFQGKQFRRCFTPAAKSRSGKTVQDWHKFWEAV